MTGPSDNGLSICPLRLRVSSKKISIGLGCVSVNINSCRGDPESLGANRSPCYPQDQPVFV